MQPCSSIKGVYLWWVSCTLHFLQLLPPISKYLVNSISLAKSFTTLCLSLLSSLPLDCRLLEELCLNHCYTQCLAPCLAHKKCSVNVWTNLWASEWIVKLDWKYSACLPYRIPVSIIQIYIFDFSRFQRKIWSKLKLRQYKRFKIKIKSENKQKCLVFRVHLHTSELQGLLSLCWSPASSLLAVATGFSL